MIGLPVPQTRGTMFVPRDEARFFGLVEAVYPGDIGIGSLLRDTRLAMHGRVSSKKKPRRGRHRGSALGKV